MLFPYHPDVETLILFEKQLSQKILGISSFKEDAKLVKRINKFLGWIFEEEELLKQSDTILLLDNYRNFKEDKYYEIFRTALTYNKEVLIVPEMVEKLNLEAYDGKYQIVSKGIEEEFNIKEEFERIRFLNRRYEMDTPIVAIAGMGRHSGKFECQLQIKQLMEDRGYNVCWITSNSLGCFCGAYSLPAALFRKEYSYADKIIDMNHFVYRLVKKTNPDVVLIGIPEGIAEFEEGENNHFGEYPLIIGNAVNIDSAVFCMYYMNTPNKEGIEKLCTHIKERFYIPVDVVTIGRNVFEKDVTKKEIGYCFLDMDYLEKHYSDDYNGKDKILRIWNKDAPYRMIEIIIGRLENNLDTV